MRKKAIIILTVAVFMALFIGCGQKVKEPLPSEETELEDYNEADPEIAMEADAPIVDEKVHYECMEEIKNASPESGLVQIDDMLFQYGSKLSEALETIQQSEGTYTLVNELDENELVLSGDAQTLRYMKNDEFYFEIMVFNYDEDTAKVKDCTIKMIQTYKAAKENVYYAGFSGNQESISYDYVKNLMQDYEATESTSYDTEGNKKINVLYVLPSNASVKDYIYIYFIFESTGEFRAFAINNSTWDTATL